MGGYIYGYMLKILRFFIRPLIQTEGKSFWTGAPGAPAGPVFDISDILDTGGGRSAPVKMRESTMTAALCIRKRGSRPAAAAVERGIAGELTSGVAAGVRVRCKGGRRPWAGRFRPQNLGRRGMGANYTQGNPASAGLFWDHDRPAAA